MDYQKYSSEQLLEYYRTNNKYFMELANYYYKNDPDFYRATVLPIIEQNKPSYNQGSVSITCPYCHNTVTPFKNSRISTGGIVMIVAGILLAPILIGIVMIFIGIAMKDYYSVCPMCRMKLG